MSRTRPRRPEDEAFIAEFARQLNEKYGQWTRSDKDFADSLDVTRPALKKYLNGKAMPGPRTLALAYEAHGIRVRYGHFDIKMLVARAKMKRHAPEGQMLLPFAIESLKQENIKVTLSEKKSNRIALNVKIKFAS